jgi:hypothetical protein
MSLCKKKKLAVQTWTPAFQHKSMHWTNLSPSTHKYTLFNCFRKRLLAPIYGFHNYFNHFPPNKHPNYFQVPFISTNTVEINIITFVF